jgi:hypothetical protein
MPKRKEIKTAANQQSDEDPQPVRLATVAVFVRQKLFL